MSKIRKNLKNNIVSFPSKLNNSEREVEAIIFAAAEPLDIDTILSKITKKINVQKILEKFSFCSFDMKTFQKLKRFTIFFY